MKTEQRLITKDQPPRHAAIRNKFRNRTTSRFLQVCLCGAPLALGLLLASKVAAQLPVVTATPKIKLAFKLPDLWCPTGSVCNMYYLPAYNPVTGILTVAVGNAGSASSPSCSLKVHEKRLEDCSSSCDKYYWKTIPALAPGEQKAIAVHVVKWSGGFNSGGKPIKRPRKWFITADGKKQVLELNKNNNGTSLYTVN